MLRRGKRDSLVIDDLAIHDLGRRDVFVDAEAIALGIEKV